MMPQTIARQDTVRSTRSSKSSRLTGRDGGPRHISKNSVETSWSMTDSPNIFSHPSSLAWSEYRISPETTPEDPATQTHYFAKSRKYSLQVESLRQKSRQASLDLDHQRDVYSGAVQQPQQNVPAHIRRKSMPRLKPLLRRDTSEETNSLDLDRSTVENEGLGIYTNLERDRRHEDPTERSRAYRHARSTSGTSQFSNNTTSSSGKPGSQYIHPKRQNPRPYTPPVSHSYQGSESSSEGLKIEESEHETPDTSLCSSSKTPPLRLQTTGSFTKISSSHTQSFFDSTPSSFRGQEAFSPAESVMTPHSRPSMDRGFLRKNSGLSQDPYVRAASVQAAREAFEQKEAAKARKHLEKEFDRREKQQQNLHRRKSSIRPSIDTFRRKSSVFGRPSEDINRTNTIPTARHSLDTYTSVVTEKTHATSANYYDEDGAIVYSGTGHPRDVKSAWILFLTWLRTKLFKLKKKAAKKHAE